MLLYEIPGRENIEIENIVFDYNGTIAVNGKLIQGVEEAINTLSKSLNVFILTADTYGTVEDQCKGIKAKILTFPRENAGESKRDIVKKLGSSKTVTIGNGFNDVPMFKEAILSIGIIEGEGMSGSLIMESDIVVGNIIDGINIVGNKNMVKATLRN